MEPMSPGRLKYLARRLAEVMEQYGSDWVVMADDPDDPLEQAIYTADSYHPMTGREHTVVCRTFLPLHVAEFFRTAAQVQEELLAEVERLRAENARLKTAPAPRQGARRRVVA